MFGPVACCWSFVGKEADSLALCKPNLPTGINKVTLVTLPNWFSLVWLIWKKQHSCCAFWGVHLKKKEKKEGILGKRQLNWLLSRWTSSTWWAVVTRPLQRRPPHPSPPHRPPCLCTVCPSHCPALIVSCWIYTDANSTVGCVYVQPLVPGPQRLPLLPPSYHPRHQGPPTPVLLPPPSPLLPILGDPGAVLKVPHTPEAVSGPLPSHERNTQ